MGRVGADIKMGLGPNLTLETAINPDFGQVEADPAEVNLTAFETRFPEKRPFFLEGAQPVQHRPPELLLLAPHRRAADRARGRRLRRLSRMPTTILAAAKLTGRLPSKTSIGFIAAVTDDEDGGGGEPGPRRHARDRRGAAHLSRRRPRAAGVRPGRLDRRRHRQLDAPRPGGGQPAGRPLHPQCPCASAATRCCGSRAASTSFAPRAAARS